MTGKPLTMNPDRLADIQRFYALVQTIEERIGGRRLLAECSGRMDWPRRGVYFFFEPGETRSDSGQGMRVVRIGTHAVSKGSTTTLWHRLSQHRGRLSTGGGNHRGSIFRLLVGTALAKREGAAVSSWGEVRSADALIVAREREHERRVSAYIGAMPFVWVEIGDEPGRDSMRGRIERNAIALLSNYGASVRLDPPSSGWLGVHSDRELVRESGLWNQNHVREPYDPAFLDDFERVITLTGRRA